MLYLYKNGLDLYQIIDDINGNENILIETNKLENAINYFNNEVKNRQKTTIMSFDGESIKDYR